MIYVEDQLVKVNGVVLPGLIKKIEVKEEAKIDEQEVEGSAAKPKQAVGYEDAKIIVELILDDTPTRTKYEALEAVRAIFRKPGQTVPQPIPIVSEDTAAHGIDKVLFKGIGHVVESKKEQIAVSLEFWEYVPQTITAGKANSLAQGTTDSNLTQEYQSYLSKNRGKSPAVDNADTGKLPGLITQLPY